MKSGLFFAISVFGVGVVSAADIIVCDQAGDQSIRVYDASLPGDSLGEPIEAAINGVDFSAEI